MTMARKVLGILAGLMLGVAASTGGANAMGDKIVVASKIDTEGALLGNMIVQVLEHAGLPVENKVSLGPTKIVRTAILSGDIDIYPEYTGNAGFFFNVDSDPAWKNGEAGYEKAKSLDAANKIVWLAPAPRSSSPDRPSSSRARRRCRASRRPTASSSTPTSFSSSPVATRRRPRRRPPSRPR